MAAYPASRLQLDFVPVLSFLYVTDAFCRTYTPTLQDWRRAPLALS